MPHRAKIKTRIMSVTLDEISIGRGTADQEHERAVAIYDIVETSSFMVADNENGPYQLRISVVENKLALHILDTHNVQVMVHILSMAPFRKIIRDYHMVCDSYHEAIRHASPMQIEAIDMGRRGLHDEAAELLIQRLGDKVQVDFETARRIFTLIFALHWKG